MRPGEGYGTRRGRWCPALAGACGLLAAAILAAPGARAQGTDALSQSEPYRVVLTYRGEEASGRGDRAGCTGGGLTGALNCVTARMAGEGQGGASEPEEGTGATLTLELVARLENAAGARFYRIVLEVGRQELRLSGLPPATEKTLRREAARVLRGLRGWSYLLSDEEARRLRRQRRFTVAVKRPFARLALFSRPELMVTVPFRIPRPRREPTVRFVVRFEEGYISATRLPRGQPFRIEVSFPEPPEEDRRRVTLSWGERKRTVEVVRTPENRQLYRSAPYYVAVGAGPGPAEGSGG